MTQPKRPIEVLPGNGSVWTGWQKPLERLAAETLQAIEGILDRIDYATRPSLKSAYRARRVFQPETQSFLLDTAQGGQGTNAVNYVMRDGKTYEIPFQFTAEGVFVARFMKVAIKQRLYVTPWGRAAQMAVGYNGLNSVSTANDWTTKFSIYPVQPAVGGSASAVPRANFFWSMRDNTGWDYSDNLQSHVMLLPNTVNVIDPGESDSIWVPVLDGGLYEFDAPLVFERDGQCVFKFRPTTPILQFDSSLSGAAGAVGLPFDDRESGVRNQAVTVTVELHGRRFLNDQDAMRTGALTRKRKGEP